VITGRRVPARPEVPPAATDSLPGRRFGRDHERRRPARRL